MPPLTLEQHERLWAISETPMALVDLTDRFVRCNQAFCSIVGYSESELQLRKWTDITHPDDLAGDIASTVARKGHPHRTVEILAKRLTLLWSPDNQTPSTPNSPLSKVTLGVGFHPSFSTLLQITQ